MKKKVGDIRAKAADIKSHGKHEAVEEVLHESRELYQQFKKQTKVSEHRMNREQHAMDRLHVTRQKLHAMEERMDHLMHEGKVEEAEELHRRIRKLTAEVEAHRERKESEREDHGHKRGHRAFREQDEENAHRSEKRDGERHDRKDIPHEDHIHSAIEHLHAAGWHDMAEHLEQELHQRMEYQRQHDDHSFNSQMRQLMEGVEHPLNAVREQVEHMERALEESAHRMELLEKRARESHSRRNEFPVLESGLMFADRFHFRVQAHV